MSIGVIGAIGAVASVASNLLMVVPKGAIGITANVPNGIQIQATLEERMEDTLRVTEHPVQAGAEISDHAYYRPAELVMRCGWSNSSAANLLGAVTNLFSSGDSLASNLSQFAGLGVQASDPIFSGGGLTVSDYVSGVYSQLLSLQQSLQPFSVITSIRKYDNMMLTSLTVTRDQQTSQALMCTATMKQVILVDTVATSLAPASSMAAPQNNAEQFQAGSQALSTGTTPSPGGSPGSVAWPPGSL